MFYNVRIWPFPVKQRYVVKSYNIAKFQLVSDTKYNLYSRGNGPLSLLWLDK